FNQLIGLPASLLIPIIAGKFRSQRSIIMILCFLALSGYIGILIGTSYEMMVTSVVLLGIAYGGLFPLSLIFLGLRAKNALEAAKLSGMAHAVGYLLAATWPISLGYLLDLPCKWNASIYTLIVTCKKCTRSSETFRYGTSSWLFTRSNSDNLIRILARFNREVERIHLHFNWYNNIHCINRFWCWSRPSCFEVII